MILLGSWNDPPTSILGAWDSKSPKLTLFGIGKFFAAKSILNEAECR